MHNYVFHDKKKNNMYLGCKYSKNTNYFLNQTRCLTLFNNSAHILAQLIDP